MNDLILTKTLTINKALALAPPGTVDPTPHLYDTTMYTLGGLMIVSVLSHYMIKPMPTVPVVTEAVVTEIKDVAEKSGATSGVKKD